MNLLMLWLFRFHLLILLKQKKDLPSYCHELPILGIKLGTLF